MFATNNPTLSQPPRPDGNPEQEAHDREALAGALSALSALAVTWLRRNGASPSQGHWESVALAQREGVTRAR
jgi:hypothetical protein